MSFHKSDFFDLILLFAIWKKTLFWSGHFNCESFIIIISNGFENITESTLTDQLSAVIIVIIVGFLTLSISHIN
jgi:hypothetical protein